MGFGLGDGKMGGWCLMAMVLLAMLVVEIIRVIAFDFWVGFGMRSEGLERCVMCVIGAC